MEEGCEDERHEVGNESDDSSINDEEGKSTPNGEPEVPYQIEQI